MFRGLATSVDRVLFGKSARVLRTLALQAQQRGMPGLARSMDWTAEKIWTAGGAGYWHSTDPRRKVLEQWRPRGGTINQALAHDLPSLARQGDHLDRTTPLFRSTVEGRKAELIGTGIGVDPDTGDEGLNDALRTLWDEQADAIGVYGESLWELQRIASGALDTGGSIIWRGLVLPERVPDGLIPWCVMNIPQSWYATNPVEPIPLDHRFCAGIEMDRMGRAIAAHLINPEENASVGERIELGKDAQHIFERRWALQANGAPRLATLIERILQDDETVINEMKAGRVAGALAVVVNDDLLREAYLAGKLPPDFMDIDGGTVSFVGEASKVSGFSHDRPSSNVSAWRDKVVKGDVAAGGQVSKVWTDRDGSAYNFSNSKFDQIRTQMVVKPAQGWFGKSAASWPYENALPYLMMMAGRPWPSDRFAQRRLKKHNLIPDVPPELDEKAAAEGFKIGRAEGVTTRADFLHNRGKDPKAVAKQLAKESMADAVTAVARIAAAQKLCDEANLANPNLKLHWSMIVALPGATSAPGEYLKATAAQQSADQATTDAQPAAAP